MKVLLVNGSSKERGCTARGLAEVAKGLQESGVEPVHFFIGNGPMKDCQGCGGCTKGGRCIFNDDRTNAFLDQAAGADGFVFGSPVYYAHPSGRLLSFMDRAFYADIFASPKVFSFKPAAAVLSARRAGTTASFDVINKYFTISSMPVVASEYWNAVHGRVPEDVEQDLEGLRTLYNLGKNMAWLLKCIGLGRSQGLVHPENEKLYTNFIRTEGAQGPQGVSK